MRRGVSDVTVIERAHAAQGSSGLSVGVIETQYVEPLDIELRARAMPFFAELERDHDFDITRTGHRISQLRLSIRAGALRAARGLMPW